MSEENQELISLGDLGIQTSEEMDGELDVLTKTSDYLPQIRVYGSENNLVKEGKFPLGTFGLYHSSDKVVEMGTEFNAICIAARPRACIIGDTPVSYYDFKSDSFTEVKDKAMAKTDGHLVGLEYLFWVPNLATFALFFMGTITLRRESSNVKALLGKGITSKIKLIKGKKYTWHGCECYPCSATMDLPVDSDLRLELDRFKNPPASEMEVVKDGEGNERAR